MAITTSDENVDRDTLCLPQQLAKAKRREGRGGFVVTFKEKVQVRATTHYKSDEQIIEERNAKWYSRHDIQQMRTQHFQTILALDRVSESDREMLKNIYGIDSVESRNVRQDRIRSVCLAVLEEQEKQWDLQKTDETKIARKVQMASIIAAKEAQLRGIQVMREVVRDTIQEVQSEPTVSYKTVGALEVARAKPNMICDRRWSSPFRRASSGTSRKAANRRCSSSVSIDESCV